MSSTWIDELANGVVSELGPEVRVERLRAEKQAGPEFVGLFLEPTGVECAASIEVWLGADGWIVSIGSTLREELALGAPSSHARVEDLIWGTIRGGVGVYHIGKMKFLIVGNHQPLASSTARSLGLVEPNLVEQWCSWYPASLDAARVEPIPSLAIRIH